MSNKSLLKFGAAFVVLAVVLIFLGVNYVPRIFASSSSQWNIDVAEKQTHLLHTHYTSEQYQQRIALQLSYVKSDWIERHSSNYYGNSDWIERHPSMYNYIRPIGTERFITPPPMSTIRLYGTERFFTPPPTDYTP